MTYDLSLATGWHPDEVRRLTVDDLDGLRRAADRRDRRAKGRR